MLVKKPKIPIVTAACMVIICSILVSLWIAAVVHRQEPPLLQERVKSFLTDVMEVNLTEYEIANKNYNPFSRVILTYSGNIWGVPFSQTGIDEYNEEQVSLSLRNSEGEFPLLFYFSSETHMVNLFSQQIISDQASSPIPSPDKEHILDWINNFLEKYQVYSDYATYISDIREAFNHVKTVEPINMTVGDVQIRISAYEFAGYGGFLSVSMVYNREGVIDESKMMTLVFRNGVLRSFTDTWNVN